MECVDGDKKCWEVTQDKSVQRRKKMQVYEEETFFVRISPMLAITFRHNQMMMVTVKAMCT